jgi:sorbitol/mannitol transport system permease protein
MSYGTLRKRSRTDAIFSVLAWLAVLAMFSPVAWMALTSFKSEEDAIAVPPKLLFEPTLEHYRQAFSSGFTEFLVNSFIATGVSTLLVIVLAVPAAYALSIRPIPRWRDVLFFLISTKMMPLAASIVPLYLVGRTLGLLNSTGILIIVYLSMNLPLAIWMLRSFMGEIPREITDAVRVDGAGRLRELVLIVVPLIKPGVASTALLCAIFAWNEYFLAVNLTSTNSTLPVFLQKFLSFGELYNAQVAAVAVLVNLPVVLAGWLAQKSLTRGLTFGAVR